jgi:hypothetical protein
MDHLILCGVTKQPFAVVGGRNGADCSDRASSDYAPAALQRDSAAVCRCRFGVAFRFEGNYKVRPVLLDEADERGRVANDDSFVPTLSFNVVTKV